MPKQSYKIPDSLDKSRWDYEIDISGGSSAKKPISIKIIVLYLVSGLTLFFLMTNTFLKYINVGLQVIFVILWIALSILLFTREKTGELKVKNIPVISRYIRKDKRRVYTRESSPSLGLYSVCQINDIDPQMGTVKFADGTIGSVYEVVGSGSRMLFDADKVAVLTELDAFYRTMNHGVQYIFVTTKEAQRVDSQLQALDAKIARETNQELLDLLYQQRDYLATEIGKRYRTIHQYLIIKANNREALTSAEEAVEKTTTSSDLIFKECNSLFGEDLYTLFRMVFRGKETV